MFNTVGEKWFCTLQFFDFDYVEFIMRCAYRKDIHYYIASCPD